MNYTLMKHLLLANMLMASLTGFSQSLGVHAVSAQAGATISVTANSDDLEVNGNCTLREAIQAANLDRAVDACPAGSGSDVIQLTEGTYTLSLAGQGDDDNLGGDLDISSPLTIEGAGADMVMVDGAGLDRVFHILASAGVVSLSGLTIRNGESGDGDDQTGGGGILNRAELTLSGANVLSNGANGHSSYQGGGILNFGIMSLSHVILRENWAEFDGLGAGIANWGQMMISDSQIIENYTWDAAGIYNASGANAVISATIISNNVSSNWGCGIYNNGGLSLSGSQVSGNQCEQGGGLLVNGGETSIQTSQITGNQAALGGGLLVKSGSVALVDTTLGDNQGRGAVVLNGILTIERSTVRGNSGGILIQDGGLAMTNSTISSNDSTGNGAGLLVTGGDARLESVTVSQNQILTEGMAETNGGGIAVTGGLLHLHNTLVAGNQDHTLDQYHPDLVFDLQSLDSQGYNLVGELDQAGYPQADGDQVGTAASPINPRLDMLSDHGGFTDTHLPQATSPAIDSADPQNCPRVDQRNQDRPTGNTTDRCDIGSVEVQNTAGEFAPLFISYLPFIQ